MTSLAHCDVTKKLSLALAGINRSQTPGACLGHPGVRDKTILWPSYLHNTIPCTYLLLLISMLWHRQAIFESKGDKLSSSAECRIRTQRVSGTESPADWMPADKPTELSSIKKYSLYLAGKMTSWHWIREGPRILGNSFTKAFIIPCILLLHLLNFTPWIVLRKQKCIFIAYYVPTRK